MPPVNDDFANAIDLGATASGSTTGTNVDATVETDEPNAGDYGDVTVWWKWTCPAGKITATFRLLGSTNTTSDPGAVLDTVLYAYDPSAGPLITDLVLIDYNDDGPVDYTSELTFAVTPGQLYYLKVDGYSSDMQGDLVLAWETEAAPPPPPPPPADCGVYVFNFAADFSRYNVFDPTLTPDNVLFFRDVDSFHLCSIPLFPLGSLTDWGSFFGSYPIATASRLAWVSKTDEDGAGAIEISTGDFSDPLTTATVAFSDTTNHISLRNIVADADGEHVIALVQINAVVGAPNQVSKIWRINLDDGTHVELHSSSFDAVSGSPTDSDLAVVGVNRGLEVTPNGNIWAGTETGKYFVLAPDGSSFDVFSANGPTVLVSRCDNSVIAFDPNFSVTISGVPTTQFVNAEADHTVTARDCEPFERNAKSVQPINTGGLGRRADWKRLVFIEILQSDSSRELWAARCPARGGWNAGLGAQHRTTGWTVT